jgi:uncharacterized membrane protein HdeD (DUF308 family)
MQAMVEPGSVPSDPMSAQLARNWWLVLLRGVIAILFGIAAFAAPVAVMLSLALLFAIYLLVDGVFGIAASVRAATHHQRWGWLLAEGVLSLVMGVVALLFPGAWVLAFVIVTAVWALASGGMMLVAAFRLHPAHGRIWLALGGIVSLVWGVLLLLAPMLGALVLTWWLGAYAIVFGAALLVLGFRLRTTRQQPPSTTGASPDPAPAA